MANTFPRGWYPAADKPGYERMWDGSDWTPAYRKTGSSDAAPRRKWWQIEAPSTSGPRVLATGPVGPGTTMTIFADGTFTTQGGLGARANADALVGFEYDSDSMRRKSATGRTAAFLITGGASLAASNNRGVLYVTVTGEQTGVRTFTTRNPHGSVLTSVRSLKAAADGVSGRRTTQSAPVVAIPSPSSSEDVSGQLAQLADLHAAGVLTDDEFSRAKARVLG